jgi:TetR/AcrR family transcriptional regulator, fatty acid biosynthesis regulator
VQTARLTRKESAELTRRRLIDGAIEILRRDGFTAATTGRIAGAAGLKQPSFYVHFSDRDAVFQAAAAEIGRRVIEMLKRQLTEFDPADASRSIRASFAATTSAFLAEPELTRIFLRHRADDGTVLGRTFRGLLDQIRSQLVDIVARYDVSLPRQFAAAHVELLVAGMLGLLEGLLDGRLDDLDAAIDAISVVTSTMFRMLSDHKTTASATSGAHPRVVRPSTDARTHKASRPTKEKR